MINYFVKSKVKLFIFKFKRYKSHYYEIVYSQFARGFKLYFDFLPQNSSNQSIEEPDFIFQQYCLKSNDTLKDTYYEKYFQSNYLNNFI
jgi:hypothetical protein